MRFLQVLNGGLNRFLRLDIRFFHDSDFLGKKLGVVKNESSV